MEVNLVRLSASGIERERGEITPFGFKMSEYVRWGYLVSDEERKVERNEVVMLRVRPIQLPPNTMISSMGVIKHPFGAVLDVLADNVGFERGKTIEKVIFVATDDGMIEKEDLLGVIKVIFIGVGLVTKLKTVEVPKTEYGDEMMEFTVKSRVGSKVTSKRTKKSTHGYWRSNLAYVEAIISDEDFRLRAGEVREVKIKDFVLPPFSVVVMGGVVENADVYPVEVFGEGGTNRIEEERIVSRASVIGLEDCKVRKGEFLGSVSVYYVATRKPEIRLKETRISKAYFNYKEDDIKEKRLRYIHPLCFKRKDKARWDIIVADENRKVRKGLPVLIKIREIVITENSIVTPLYIVRNAIGTTLGVYQPGMPPEITDEKFISHALFLPVMDGEIKKGDLLGIINVYRVEPMNFKSLTTKLESWKDYVGYKMEVKR